MRKELEQILLGYDLGCQVLDIKTGRGVDCQEVDAVDAAALKALILAGVELNMTKGRQR